MSTQKIQLSIDDSSDLPFLVKYDLYKTPNIDAIYTWCEKNIPPDEWEEVINKFDHTSTYCFSMERWRTCFLLKWGN